MTTRKVILFSLILPIGLSALELWVSRKSHKDMSEQAIFVFISFTPWAVGLMLGLFLSAIFKRPKAEPYFYLSGQLAVILTILIFIASIRYQDYQHDRKFGNMESNRSFAGIRSNHTIDSVNYSNHIRTAFLKLESTFANPNSFLIIEQTSRHIDTSADDNARIYYFTYLVKKKKLFSRIMVVNDAAIIQILNADIRFADDYQLQAHRTLLEKQQFMDSMLKVIDRLPDSTSAN